MKKMNCTVITMLLITLLFGCTQIKKADSNETTVGYLYTVKDFNGNVAVFKYGSDIPDEILECRISSLPQEAADVLKSGIDVSNYGELQLLIEAFD